MFDNFFKKTNFSLHDLSMNFCVPSSNTNPKKNNNKILDKYVNLCFENEIKYFQNNNNNNNNNIDNNNINNKNINNNNNNDKNNRNSIYSINRTFFYENFFRRQQLQQSLNGENNFENNIDNNIENNLYKNKEKNNDYNKNCNKNQQLDTTDDDDKKNDLKRKNNKHEKNEKNENEIKTIGYIENFDFNINNLLSTKVFFFFF
jgi:hypothetical protein